MANDAPAIQRKFRCAVYTRKSSEEGLEQEFNSLDAQREACEAYVASQRAEGWLLLSDRYDDGGFSGGTLERPALKRLLADIEARRVDIVVVYKIDRLSRALMDFAKLVEVFDRTGVTFVSVTQSFSTSTSMGRLTLNVLLSFAQFEREVIGERIRDKFAASRKKGMWMGGNVPLGYEVRERKLVINDTEADLVRSLFTRFAKLGSCTKLVRELASENVRNRYGKLIDKGGLYKFLNNRVYVGEAVHKGTSYPGEHKAIVDRTLWDKVHSVLKESPRKRAQRTRAQTPALLKGLVFGANGVPMTPTHSRKSGKLYRYYIATSALRSGVPDASPIRRIPASEIEAAVVGQIKQMVQSPEIVVATWRVANAHISGLTERQVRHHLHSFTEIWSELFPAEQARIVQLLVARVDVSPVGADIVLKTDGLGALIQDLQGEPRSAEDSRVNPKHQAPGTITVHVPLRFTVRGGRKTIVIGQSSYQAPKTRFDNSIAKALARAYRWKQKLDDGTYETMVDLAKAERINESYVTRLIRLNLLAPDIVEAALNGRTQFTVQSLTEPISPVWMEQRTELT